MPGFGTSTKADAFAQGCATPGLSTTQCLVKQNKTLFQGRFVSSLFQNMGLDRRLLGQLPYNNLQVVLALFVRTHTDLVLDGGDLPGMPSTVVDLRAFERDGQWSVAREGAVSVAEVAARLDG